MGRRLAGRFVAGTTVEDAVAVCERVNAQGMAVSLDSLGESVTLEAEARAAAEVYHRRAGCDCGAGAECECESETDRRWVLRGIGRADAGEDNGEGIALAEEIVGGVVEHAARAGRVCAHRYGGVGDIPRRRLR